MDAEGCVADGWAIEALLAELAEEGLADHGHGAIDHHAAETVGERGTSALDGDPIFPLTASLLLFTGNGYLGSHRLRRGLREGGRQTEACQSPGDHLAACHAPTVHDICALRAMRGVRETGIARF